MMPNGEHQIIGPDRSQIFDVGVNFLSLRHQCENPYCTTGLSRTQEPKIFGGFGVQIEHCQVSLFFRPSFAHQSCIKNEARVDQHRERTRASKVEHSAQKGNVRICFFALTVHDVWTPSARSHCQRKRQKRGIEVGGGEGQGTEKERGETDKGEI